MSLRARALDLFVEPRPDAAPPPAFLPPERARSAELAAAARAGRSLQATRSPLRAAVLGAAPEAMPVGALLAQALRAAAGCPAAVVAAWTPGVAGVRAAPATIAASRLAARLVTRSLPAVARGRLAWMALDEHPVAAAVAARRAAAALEVPLVAVLSGPRCEVVEGLLAEQDLVVVVASEPGGPLARLAVAGCAAPALSCAPPPAGPARWLARGGLAGAHGLPASLRSFVRELAAAPPAAEPFEVAW